MKIGQLAEIKSGVFERPEPVGEVYYIQIRHFDKNQKLIDNIVPELPESKAISGHYLQKGDVIVASRGSDNFSIAYKGHLKPAVASSTFLVIRIREKDKVLPEYLAWFLNLPATKSLLQRKSKGTSIPLLTKSDIANIEIEVPEIKIQESILRVAELHSKEKELSQRLMVLREELLIEKLLSSTRK